MIISAKYLLFFLSILICNHSFAGAEDLAFVDAISTDDTRLAKDLIVEGADVDFRSLRGKTPLMIAAIFGYTKSMQLLIDNNADLYLTDKRKRSAIEYAIQNEHLEAIIILLENGNFTDEELDEIISKWDIVDEDIIREINIYKASHNISKAFMKSCPTMISDKELPGMTRILKEFSAKIQDVTVVANIKEIEKAICKSKGRNFKDAIVDIYLNSSHKCNFSKKKQAA